MGCFLFFKQKTAYEMRISDWSSDVCSSDLLGGQPVVVACTQEAPLFREIAAEDNPDAVLDFVNIREAAGWSDEAKAATPKIAALLAAAMVEAEPASLVTLTSQGVCLVYGRDEQAIEAARQLAGRLDVTVLLSAPAEVMPPTVMDVPIFTGLRGGSAGGAAATNMCRAGPACSLVGAT